MQYLSQQHICESIGSTHDPETEYLDTEVVDMFNNKNPTQYENSTDPKMLTWIATYYESIEKNETKMLEFLSRAVELGDSNAMNNLGCYYFRMLDFDSAEKIWLQSGKSQNNLKQLEITRKDFNEFMKIIK